MVLGCRLAPSQLPVIVVLKRSLDGDGLQSRRLEQAGLGAQIPVAVGCKGKMMLIVMVRRLGDDGFGLDGQSGCCVLRRSVGGRGGGVIAC